MKKHNLLGIIGLVYFASIFFGCSAEDGEDGAIGPQGPQGEQGIPGVDGQDGNANAILWMGGCYLLTGYK